MNKMEQSNLITKEKAGKNQIKSIDIFINLKTNYFLRKVFKNLSTKK